jgi:putative ABC transport system permease protein
VTTAWHKVVRDVWRERARGMLVVLAIALGLAAFFAVLSTYAILRRELNRGYRATNPASAVLLTDAVDDRLLATVIARDDVEDADARRVITGRLRTEPGEWRRFLFFVLRDFERLRINIVTPDAGAWPPPAGSLLIERDAFSVARARIGDTVVVKTSAGRERVLRVAGRAHDPGQAQARMENMVYGYITAETASRLGEESGLDRLYLLVAGDRLDKTRVTRVASDVKAVLETIGHPVHRIDIPAPGEHPHAAIMGVLLLAMAAFGLLVVALSGVIVLNLLLAIMAAERRQIGVMKAIGATRAQIVAIYLAEAALFGIAAIVIAIPSGIAFGGILSRYFAELLNFDLASLATPAWVYLMVMVVGMAVPLAAAAYPVALGTALTVREAVSAGGSDLAGSGTGQVSRLLARIGRGRHPLLLGVRNLPQRPTRTGLTLVTLSLAGAFFITAINIRASMMATADRLFGAGTFGAISRYSLDQHMLMIYVFLLIVAGVLAAVGGLGLVTATSLNVLDRRRELGVLRAIGATPATVAAIVATEAIASAVVSSAIAEAAAWGVTTGLGRLFAVAIFRGRFDLAFPAAGPAAWLAIAIVLSIAASLVPAIGASRRSVREAVNYE